MQHHFSISLIIFLLFLILSSETSPSAITPNYTYKIINTYPHDRAAFTQGLIFNDGFLYESTGLYGRSSLRKVNLKTGMILKKHLLPPLVFAEGITLLGTKIIQLTWKSKMGFVYNKENFEVLQTFHYPTEGWGITNDGKQLIMSDGSSTLFFLDPETFKEIDKIDVRDQEGAAVKGINELEYIKGEIFANIWPTMRIARISPKTGKVMGWIDLAGVVPLEKDTDVLNGIAYDEKNDRLFVTGKLWPKVFEIKIF
ncbi:MAG TPA: glutaminyl-peptide cyclotransferase [Candidatus Woesebacteria bacterium]|nr:glutaminyl-peptide cyclotransferase [Candidatus Woesebacteria bacterium]